MALDEARKASITNALNSYRKQVLDHSIALLKILVEGMEAQPTPPNWSEKMANEARMHRFAYSLLTGKISDMVSTPTGILDPAIRDDLVEAFSLDGVNHGPPIAVQRREEWYSAIQEAISSLDQQILAQGITLPMKLNTITFPEELQYLYTLVRGISGPALLHKVQFGRQYEFLSVFEAESTQATKERVIVPLRADDEALMNGTAIMNDLTVVWELEEIAIAIKIGCGDTSYGGTYALFCFKNDGGWAWRYGLHNKEWGSKIYDTVEEFLPFYAEYRSTTEKMAGKEIRPLDLLPEP